MLWRLETLIRCCYFLEYYKAKASGSTSTTICNDDVVFNFTELLKIIFELFIGRICDAEHYKLACFHLRGNNFGTGWTKVIT